MPVKAIFFDRDGTINRSPGHGKYVLSSGEADLIPGAVSALKRLADAGYALAVLSSQKCVGLGFISLDEVNAINLDIDQRLAQAGVRILGWYICPHLNEDGCACRKPKPGLVLQAARDLGVDPAMCWNVGDRIRDMQMGLAAGCKNVLVVDCEDPQWGRAEELVPEARIVKDIGEAAELILHEDGRSA